MDFKFSEEVAAVRDLAKKFADKEIRPRVAADEKAHAFQRDLVEKMGELGFFGCPIPEEYGGSNLGFLAHTVICEEIAKVSGSLRAAFNMQTMGTAREIYQFGTPEQKALEEVTAAEMMVYAEQGHFPAGSMQPKIEASLSFLKKEGRRVIITSPENMKAAMSQQAGTHIVN